MVNIWVYHFIVNIKPSCFENGFMVNMILRSEFTIAQPFDCVVRRIDDLLLTPN
jgi:hypothetical protein